MKIIKKILLIFIGIILSLVILEFSLQTLGFTLTTIKKYRNKITKDSNTVTILCLGESTTSGEWPPILQKILNEKSKNKKFNVIDEGRVGTNSKIILSRIYNYLYKYNPDCVVTMIGINDVGLIYKKSKFKIINLIFLIKEHINTFIKYTYMTYDLIDPICQELVIYKNNKELAYKLYWLSFKNSKFKDHMFYTRLWDTCCLEDEKNCSLLLKYNDVLLTEWSLRLIINYLERYKFYSLTDIKNFIIKNKDRIVFDNYYDINKLLTKYDCLYLMEDIRNNKEKNRKDSVYQKRKLLQIDNHTNYLNIIKSIKEYNASIVVLPMQYPMLSIEILKQDLKNSPYYDELIFISNEENFKQALQNYKTENIFVDRFARDFGHCTELGNTLIAENVAETILKLYN